jgi:uncharacterized protein YegL
MADCSHCGYSGVVETEQCPYCGEPLAKEAISEVVLLDEANDGPSGTVTYDLGPAPLALPDTHADLQVSVRYEYSAVPADDPPVTGLLVGIEAFGEPLAMQDRGPLAHVVLALDVSASMDRPDKFPVLRSAVCRMLDDLREEGAANVLLSVVIFSRRAAILLRDTPARDVRMEDLFRLIGESPLCFGDYTDIAGALSHAGRIAYDQRKASPSIPIRLYLLTDGKPQDLPRARAMATRVGKVTADLHGLAFGSDADVVCLQELFAGKRGGTVKSVREDTIEVAFERVATVARKVVATRCLVEMDLAPGVVGGDAFRYRPARVKFPAPAFEEGKRFRADLGTIETDRSYQLLFELRPPEDDANVTQLGRFSVRIPGLGDAISESVELSIPRLPKGSLPGDVDSAVRTARDILTALTDGDPQRALRALRLRLAIYERERRDPDLLALIQRAIDLLESEGSLESLTAAEHATLLAHTCTT